MDDKAVPALGTQIEKEVRDYLTKNVQLGDGVSYSQNKLVRRIFLFETHTYPTGKFDSQGNYKHWFDIASPAIDGEVKNIDFDTKNVEVYSPNRVHEVADLIVNLSLRNWMRDNGQAEELNSAIEEGAGWGNIVWKKVKGSYERADLRNFYVINQTAQSLKATPVIERHKFTQTDLRAFVGKWESVEDVIQKCGENSYKSDASATGEETTTPYYTILERNGEVKVSDLKAFNGEAILEGDRSTYTLAKVIAAGVEGSQGNVDIKYVLFAREIGSMPYKEYHRGRYKGRWMREGLYELLFDLQVRANEIGNQLARGLEWAAKTFFRAKDKLLIQNILSDLKNGDVIRSEDFAQIEVRMQGFDQLLAEWNRIIDLRNEIANSREVVQGEAQPGQPFKLGALLNVNANKLYDLIREKISIPFREIFEEWIVPRVVADIKPMDVLRLTGDSDLLIRLKELVVDDWYIRNLIAIGPHTPEIAEALKAEKIEELKSKPLFLKEFSKMLEGYKAQVSVVITGENIDLDEKLQTLGTFIALEADPVRRSYLIEKAMRLKGIDTGSLPRSTPDQLHGVRPSSQPVKSPLSMEAEAAA